jgi:Lipid A 3-O-deacylase (PagL)
VKNSGIYGRAAGLITAAVLAVGFAPNLTAQEFRVESIGARLGWSPHSGTDFYEAEVFVDHSLPWNWDLGRDWRLRTYLDLSAGWLNRSDTDTFIGSLGPGLRIQHERCPVSLDGGVSPTVISTHKFGRLDLGDWFQFTSHVGLNWDIGDHWRVGYRYQHMSNAGISSHNPGLNMQMLAFSFRF